VQIVSLDLGTITAWCRGETTQIGVVPEWDWWQLAGTVDLNGSFLGHYNELWELLENSPPAYVVYETPLSQAGRDASRSTVDLHIGLAAVTRLVCTLLDVPVYEQTFAETRKLVLGKGGFPKPMRGVGKISKRTGKLIGDAKEEVRLWVEQYGWGGIEQEDARDAAVLFRFAQMICQGRVST
jgi:hypothetical protein